MMAGDSKKDYLPEEFDKLLQESKNYLGYCIKEGAVDESQLEGKTDEELIKMAQDLMGKADAYADSVVKGE